MNASAYQGIGCSPRRRADLQRRLPDARGDPRPRQRLFDLGVGPGRGVARHLHAKAPAWERRSTLSVEVHADHRAVIGQGDDIEHGLADLGSSRSPTAFFPDAASARARVATSAVLAPSAAKH